MIFKTTGQTFVFFDFLDFDALFFLVFLTTFETSISK